jgi:hypothetical protein
LPLLPLGNPEHKEVVVMGTEDPELELVGNEREDNHSFNPHPLTSNVLIAMSTVSKRFFHFIILFLLYDDATVIVFTVAAPYPVSREGRMVN